MFNKLIKTTEGDWSALLLRLVLGLVMFPHATQKMFGWFGGGGIDGTLAFFAGLGIPGWVGVTVIAIEFVASVALILGVLGRLAAAGVIAVMIGAIITVHAPHGFFMNWLGTKGGEGFEYHLALIAIAAAILIRGSGALSVDRRLSPQA